VLHFSSGNASVSTGYMPNGTRVSTSVRHDTVLPSPSQLQYERAVITFLESLALWLNAKLHVVLSVDAKEAGCCLGLTDELGVGVRSLFFDVEVRDRHVRRRRPGRRIRGIGDFMDLRQLRLVPDDH
jgi:hypothetical protein